MKFVCVDIDGVVLNTMLGVKNYLREKGIHFKPENVATYNFEGDIGCKKSDVYSCFSDIKFFKEYLDYFPNAVSAISKVKDSGVQVDAYTCVFDNKDIQKYRRNFCNALGMTGSVYRGKKPTVFDADALFDDCLGVHKQWIQDGYKGKLYLIDAPHNRVETNKEFPYFDRVIRCESLDEAVELYLKEA